MREVPAPPAVVVGVDGSRAAVRAALWAVDEAVSRDIPLRLVYALDPGEDNDVHRGQRRTSGRCGAQARDCGDRGSFCGHGG
jgi:hypothetical protein